MSKKSLLVSVILFVIFLSSIQLSIATHLGTNFNEDATDWSKIDLSKFDSSDVGKYSEFIKGRENELTAEQLKGNLDKFDLGKLNPVEANKAINAQYGTSHNFKNFPPGSKIENNKLTIGDSVIDLETFKGGHTIEFVNGKLYVNGNEYVGAQDIKSDGQSISIPFIKSLTSGSSQIINGVNVKVFSDSIEAEYADTFIKDKSAASNVNNLKAKTEKFSVQSASKVVSGCNYFDNVKDSEFEIKGDDIKVTTGSNVTLNITDCSYRDIEFQSKGNGSSVTIKKDNYDVSKGKLKCGSRDIVEADNSANVEVGSNCFTCLTVNPPGTYFYLDSDIRKDFNINVPKESSVYKLCLRKNQVQQFKDYNGLVDFVVKKIELNGVVNYLRYPIKNNQILSLLSDFVYRGLKNVNALLIYDENLLFLKNVAIKNILENKQQITITKPNNYYDIKEVELEDEKIHRVVGLRVINKNQLNQDINSNYESDSLGAKIKITNGILVQDNGKSSIIILPPQHKEINSFLK